MAEMDVERGRRRTAALAAVLGLAVLGAAAAWSDDGQQGPSGALESALADGVDEGGLVRWVRELVELGPRMGGTPSGDASAAYLRRQFLAFGLETRVVEDEPLWGSWMERWRVEIASGGGAIESAHPLLFSPAVDPAREGPLVPVPDLARAAPDASWSGAVIYTPGPIGGSLYRRIAAGAHRPLAILTSAPNSPTRNADWASLGALPAGDGNPVPVFAVSYLDGRTLAGAAARGRRVRLSVVARARRAPSRTVMATLAGADAGRYYLVSAHGDSDAGGPGADDNASGVAAVMELARLLGAQARAGRLAPRVSVRFVIWGAEYHSARSYIAREGQAIDRCLGVINIDQVGTGAEREALYIEGNDVPWNAPLLRLLETVGVDYLDRPGFWSELTTTPTQGGTDAYAFLPREYKGSGHTTARIPATTLYTAAWNEPRTLAQTAGWDSPAWREPGPLTIDYSLYYHSSADTPANTTDREPQNMVRAVKLAGIGLLRLLR